MKAADPALVSAFLRQAVALHQQGRPQPAQALYRQVLELDPRQFDALHLLGVLARQAGDAAQAIALISRAIAVDDAQPAAHCNLGVALLDAGRPGDALASHERALALKPAYALAWSNRGNALRRLDRLDEALASYARALEIDPRYGQAHCNRAIALQDLGRYGEALDAAEQALRIDQRDADAWLARGHALHCLRQLPDAVDSYDRALHVRPRWVAAYCGQGASLQRLGAFEAALDSYRQALRHQPGHAPAHYQRGNALRALGRRDEAAQAYRQALAHGEDTETIAFALASVGAGATPALLPAGYVRGLFDQYANHFDHHLVDVLDYRTPARLDQLLKRAGPAGEAAATAVPPLLDTLDLGCGTGLCAPYLRPAARRLAGVDLSGQMLDKARERGLYDELVRDDLVAYLRGQHENWDLAVAADVFVYIGDLAPTFAAVARALRPGGRFCFSVEAGEDGAEAAAGAEDAPDHAPDYALRPSNRYAHTLAYLRRLAAASGLAIVATEALTVREENGAPLAAHALVLRKPA